MSTPEMVKDVQERLAVVQLRVARCQDRLLEGEGRKALRSQKALADALALESSLVDELQEVEASLKRNVPKPEIEPGCWISTRWGEAVCAAVSRYSVLYRYPATRCSDQAEIWVHNGDCWGSVAYLRPADDLSRHVLTLRGAYGLG